MNLRKKSIKNLVENALFEAGERTGEGGVDLENFGFTPWDVEEGRAERIRRRPRRLVPRTQDPSTQDPNVNYQDQEQDQENQYKQSKLGRTIDKYQYGGDILSSLLAIAPARYLARLGGVGSFLQKARYLLPWASAGVDVGQAAIERDPSQVGDAISRGLVGGVYKTAPIGSYMANPRDAARFLRRPPPTGFIRSRLPTAVQPATATRMRTAGVSTTPAWKYILGGGILPLGLGAGLRELGVFGGDGGEAKTQPVNTPNISTEAPKPRRRSVREIESRGIEILKSDPNAESFTMDGQVYNKVVSPTGKVSWFEPRLADAARRSFEGQQRVAAEKEQKSQEEAERKAKNAPFEAELRNMYARKYSTGGRWDYDDYNRAFELHKNTGTLDAFWADPATERWKKLGKEMAGKYTQDIVRSTHPGGAKGIDADLRRAAMYSTDPHVRAAAGSGAGDENAAARWRQIKANTAAESQRIEREVRKAIETGG